jgi:hypothetical protein
MMRIFPLVILLCGCAKAESKNELTIKTDKALGLDSIVSISEIQTEAKSIVLIDFVGASEDDSVLLTRIFENSEIYFELPQSVEATTAVKAMFYNEKANYYSISGLCNNLTHVEIEFENLSLGENYLLFAYFNDKDLFKIEFDVTEREGSSTVNYSELDNVAPHKCLVLCFEIDDVAYNVGYQKRVRKHWYVLNDKSLIKILYMEMLDFELNVSDQSYEDYQIENMLRFDRSEMEVKESNKGWAEVWIQRFYNHDGIEYKGDSLRLIFSGDEYQQ